MKLTGVRISFIVFLIVIFVIIAAISAPSIIVPQSVKNSRLAPQTLRDIYYAETIYRRSNNNQFGNLDRLQREGLLKGIQGNIKDGYSFDLKEKNESVIMTAAPLKEGPVYVLDKDGIVHVGDEDGGIVLPDGAWRSRTIASPTGTNNSSK